MLPPPSGPPPPLPAKQDKATAVRPTVPEPQAPAPDLPAVESPQSPPARLWAQSESTVFVDLRRPGRGGIDLGDCLKEKQKRLRSKPPRPQLKLGELEGIRDKQQPAHNCHLMSWIDLPYKVTRCRLRLFEALLDGAKRRSLDVRQPYEGDLRTPFCPRLDWQPDARRSLPEWWEERPTFRARPPLPKFSTNEEREISSRTLPLHCRHLVVWGGEAALVKADSRTASIEALINSLLQSSVYRQIYSDAPVRANCHASFSIDRREMPGPLKVIRTRRNDPAGPSASRAPPSSVSVCEFRSMFSSMLENHRDRWNWVCSDDALRLLEEQERQPVWTGILEFPDHVACADFFDATTYANVDTNNLHSLPDYMGIKYWLHTIISTCIAATKVKSINRRVPGEANSKPSWWDAGAKVWAPFLVAKDVLHGPWPKDGATVLPDDQGVEISGSCLRLCALSLNRGEETLTVVVHNESKPWLQSYMSITGMLPSQTPLIRIPKYIVQDWKLADLAVIDEGHKYSTRVALLVFPIGRRMVLSPALLCSREQFLNATSPWVIDRGPIVAPKASS